MQCLHCGSDIVSDSRFCSLCGEAVLPMEGDDIQTIVSGARQGRGPAVSNLGVSELRVPELTGRSLTSVALGSSKSATLSPGLVPHSGGASPKRLNSHSLHALLTQANLCRMRSMWTEAIDCCVMVLRAQSNNQTAHSLLGDIYRDQGRIDDAIQWYRMAIDLRPNPSDEAKMAQLERERARLEALEIRRQRDGYGEAVSSDSLGREDGLSAGTVNLMGVSPRRWLKAIWAVSLTFLVMVLVLLIQMTSLKQPASKKLAARSRGGVQSDEGRYAIPASQTMASYSSKPVSTVTMPTSSLGGSGVRPDRPTNGQGIQPLLQRSIPQQTFPGLPNTSATNPAPVFNVRPLSGDGNSSPDRSVAFNSGDRTLPNVQGSNNIQTVPLANGLRIEQLQNVGQNRAAVTVWAPTQFAGDLSADDRNMLIRNVFRVARNTFAEDGYYLRATVFIQTQVQGIAGEAVILEATVDRSSAMAINPETDAISTLTARLSELKWSTPSTQPSFNGTISSP